MFLFFAKPHTDDDEDEAGTRTSRRTGGRTARGHA